MKLLNLLTNIILIITSIVYTLYVTTKTINCLSYVLNKYYFDYDYT